MLYVLVRVWIPVSIMLLLCALHTDMLCSSPGCLLINEPPVITAHQALIQCKIQLKLGTHWSAGFPRSAAGICKLSHSVVPRPHPLCSALLLTTSALWSDRASPKIETIEKLKHWNITWAKLKQMRLEHTHAIPVPMLHMRIWYML